MIVDVRCSSQYSKSEDAQGSESSQRLQSLQKTKKHVESHIEMLKSKESILRDVLIAFASNVKFDFGAGIDGYDEKILEVRAKREELEVELADAEKKIREIGLDTQVYSEHQVTGSIPRFVVFANLETVKVTLEAETACEVSLFVTTSIPCRMWR